MAADFVDLVYEAGRLRWPGGSARAACGRGGVRADKREGDGATPKAAISWSRPITAPTASPRRASGLALTALCPEDGWVDDPGDRYTTARCRCPTGAA